MIKHVVMWKLKDEAEGNNKEKNIELTKNILNDLVPVISEIVSLEVGENINSSAAAFDLALITSHADQQGLEGYIKHPAHQEAAEFIGKVVEERKVVDFEY